MKSPLKTVGLLGAVLILATGGWWLGQASKHRAIVAQYLPPIPDLTGIHPELQQRIHAADAQALSLTGARDGLEELSRLYHINGYLESAVQTYVGLATLEPQVAVWPHRHAAILAGFGQADEALTLWDEVRSLDPSYLPAALRRADLLLKSNRIDEASTAYQSVLEQDRDEAWAMLGLARIDLEKERWNDARRRLERVVALTDYNLGYDLIVSLYERLGLDGSAEAIRGQAAASGAYRDPTDPWLDDLMVDCYDSFRLSLEAGTKARIGDMETAMAWMNRAVQVAPDDVSAHFQLAGLLDQNGNPSGAMTHYRRCTQLDPAFADGWAQLAGLLARNGNQRQADRVLAEGLKFCPDSPGLHRMNARRMRETGNPGGAIGAYRTAIRLRPNEPDAYIELGIILISMNRRQEGVAEIEKSLVYDPLNPNALGILAFDAIDSGDQDRADHWMERIAQQPRMPAQELQRLTAAYRGAFGG